MSTFTLNRYGISSESQIPAGCVACEMKYCELCGRSFVRERQTGKRFCGGCSRPFFTPSIEAMAQHLEGLRTDQEQYRDMLPKEAEQRHAHHLPHFDRSIVPVGRATQSHAISKTVPTARRKLVRHPEWRQLVIDSFAQYGQLTMEKLCDLLPGCYTPQQAYVWCYQNKLSLVRVGWVERTNESLGGRCAGIYSLVSETVH